MGDQRLWLGIMTHRIGSPGAYAKHARAALAVGFGGAVLFTPADARPGSREIRGRVWRDGRWRKEICAYPAAAIDLGYYTNPRTIRQAVRIKNRSGIRFTGFGLGNKWTIQQHLLASPSIKAHLLPTIPLNNPESAIGFVREHGTIMIKPINGKGGQGMIKLSLKDGAFRLERNGKPAVSGSEQAAVSAVRKALTPGSRYLLQRWIDIRNEAGRVYDIRVLVQKDGKGQWSTSGTAVREGPGGSITSNIKSGGRAYEAKSYLTKRFETEKADRLLQTIGELSAHIPDHLEKSYGKRLAELGLDFAIEKSGDLWLLEANIKPGKSVIRSVYGERAAERCFMLPFRYARYLAQT